VRLISILQFRKAQNKLAIAEDSIALAYDVLKQERNHLTQYISDDYIVKDGVVIYYIKIGKTKIARVIDKSHTTKLFSDENSDGKINVADAWLLQNANKPAEKVLASSVQQLRHYIPEKRKNYVVSHYALTSWNSRWS